MKRRSILKLFAAAAVALGVGAPEDGLAEEAPIKIGVPLPLTGVLAGGGTQILWGIQYAADQVNANGGLLGRRIQLVIEDTKGEPNTSAAVAAKLATQDEVDAFVGGFGSTADFALLSSVQRYEPIFIHAGSSSVRLEENFGKHPWYFHVYIWDYHRQKAAVNFFKSIEPPVKTVALAYEDKLYGTDASKFTSQFAEEAGLEIVMNEPYRAGSPDFSPILNRVKALDPDVFFFVGYSGDNLQVARQAQKLGVDLNLLVVQGAGEKRSDYGDNGDGVVVIDMWSAEQKTAGLQDWVKEAEAARGAEVVGLNVQGYTAMMTLVEATEAVGKWDRDAIIDKLATMTFDSPYGKISYGPSEMGGQHQLITDENMVAIQLKPDMGQDVVWPADKAGGELIYPAN